MMTIREDTGASLKGLVDGINAVYTTTYPMRLDRPIEVYVNGLCRMADLDNGYFFQDASTVVMREILETGDTLSIRYNCNPPQVGVIDSQPCSLDLLADDTPGELVATQQDDPDAFQATITAC